MKKIDEKRMFERFKNDAPIVYAYHNTDQFLPAVMCDHSNGGMCFRAPDGLDPGSDIYIMMENYTPDSKHAELYEGFFAEVRWCHPLPAHERPGYRVGVKYYKTVINENPSQKCI